VIWCCRSYMMASNPRPIAVIGMLPEQKPPTEPEIIPPHYRERRSMWAAYRFADMHGTRHTYAVRLGPLGIVFMALVIAVIAAAMLLFFLGVVLIWIPTVALLVSVAIFSGLLRQAVHRRTR
jgi:hypothetical protein